MERSAAWQPWPHCATLHPFGGFGVLEWIADHPPHPPGGRYARNIEQVAKAIGRHTTVYDFHAPDIIRPLNIAAYRTWTRDHAGA